MKFCMVWVVACGMRSDIKWSECVSFGHQVKSNALTWMAPDGHTMFPVCARRKKVTHPNELTIG